MTMNRTLSPSLEEPPTTVSQDVASSGRVGKQQRRRWKNPFKKSRSSQKKDAVPVAEDDNNSLASLSSTHSSQNGTTVGTPQDDVCTSTGENAGAVTSKVGVLSTEDYGYGDAAPEEDPYGYGAAQPDHSVIYGYGDDVAADFPQHCEPTGRRSLRRRSSMPAAVAAPTARRSSMKVAGAQRRSSIEFRGEVEIHLPPSVVGERSQRVKRTISLGFEETATVKHIEPAKDLAGGKNDLWFQKDEMDSIRQKVTALIVKTENGALPESGKRYCMRGLERYLDPEATTIKKNQAWDSVLNEQYLQQREGIVEENHMAYLYKFSALRSQKDANKRASEDEKEIEKYLSSTRRMCRRMSM
jgi:hypothetical protein